MPSEALIRTGRRVLVMVAEEGGRYRPVEVQAGPESDGQTAVLNGLEEGQQVVTSGQFLLDSEASLKGIVAQPLEKNGGQP
ncbi:Cation efflux system protein CusB precursor [compost metagenome]